MWNGSDTTVLSWHQQQQPCTNKFFLGEYRPQAVQQLDQSLEQSSCSDLRKVQIQFVLKEEPQEWKEVNWCEGGCEDLEAPKPRNTCIINTIILPYHPLPKLCAENRNGKGLQSTRWSCAFICNWLQRCFNWLENSATPA